MEQVKYIRVSTGNQNTARQESEDITQFIDVCSGSMPFMERPQAKELIGYIQDGDVSHVLVSSIDRLGRNFYDILETLKFFNEHNIILKVENLGIDSMLNKDGKLKENATFKLIISVLGNIAEMEREAILERQKQGIAIAKAKGTYKGRVKGSTEPAAKFLERHKNVIKELNKGESYRRAAKLCGVSLGTVQKVRKLLDQQETVPSLG